MKLKNLKLLISLATVTILSTGLFFNSQKMANADGTPVQKATTLVEAEQVPLTVTVAVERLKDLSERERQAFLGEDDSQPILALYNSDNEGGYGFASGEGSIIRDEVAGEIIRKIDPVSDPEGTTIGAIKQALKEYDAKQIKDK